MQAPRIISLHADDNVLVALDSVPPGTLLREGGAESTNSIPAGHKVAIRNIRKGEPIRKYGQIIGFATQDIRGGEHVHTHNVEMGDFARDYAIGEDTRPTPYIPEKDRATFDGIVREDGRIGTRNYIGILASVNCSASVSRFVADAVTREMVARFPNVDGVVALGHGTGCGMAEDGEGFVLLQRVLAGYARHPNFAGILLVGLGCEVNQVDCLMENMQLQAGPQLRTINIQEAGGTRETIDRGLREVKEMLEQADSAERSPVSASHLILGLECGGSDAYSGISANPALGVAVDLLVCHGGTAILSETPEIYGAEHLLTRRAASREVGERLIQRIRWWEEHTTRLGAEINNNPTPGNKQGGLTTILEKSLGASAKGGSTNLKAVYGYGEPVTDHGLVFMDTPGHDTVSVTGMIAGGANMVCFTSGRGTVCGFKPAPTIKLASNSAVYQRLRDDMDINCGHVIDGDLTIQEMGEAVFQKILETASGKKSKSEIHGFGDNEFVPWQIGPVM